MGYLYDAKCQFKYVHISKCIRKLQFQEMNKCTLFLVFVCGVLFSGLVSLLRTVKFDPFLPKFYETSVGILPSEADLELMDDGYVALAQLNLDNIEVTKSKKKRKGNFKGTDLEERSSELEALNSLKAAVELTLAGKSSQRVGKLLEHAHSLAPFHPDVLLMYGEYLELHREDVIQADHLFLKALTVSPLSSRALRNRRRTKSLVEKLDESLLTRIDGKRNDLTLIPAMSGALRRVKREAYFQHIYHTAAIEGNTLTLSQIRMILETGLSVEGKSIMEHNEILGIDLALKYINTTLIHRVGKITLKDILEIHRRVLGHVDPIEAGTMRTTQVFVSDHVPPPPSKIELLMEGFLTWLNSDDAQKMHPIKYAALAHYKFVFIHPFSDGNGRTARLLMNFLLMQAGYPPVIIRKQDRLHYYDSLQTANDGDTRPFVRFVARCMENTIDVYLWATKEHLPELEQTTSINPNSESKDHYSMLNAVSFLIDVRSDASMLTSNHGFTIDKGLLNAPREFHFREYSSFETDEIADESTKNLRFSESKLEQDENTVQSMQESEDIFIDKSISESSSVNTKVV